MSDPGLSSCRYCNYLPDGEYLCDPSNPDMCSPCQQLLALEEKVKQIRMMLIGIESERQKLKEQVNYHHERLIHRLPPEIASEVFELCVPDNLLDLDHECLPSRYKICAPLVLSAVCRRWRDIAHSTPPLWKTIPLFSQSLHYERPNSLPGPLFVKDWIDRTGQLPLSIVLFITRSTEHDATQIIDMLNQYSDRWLEFRLDGPCLALTHLSNDGQDFPRLHKLHLTNHDDDRPRLLRLPSTQLKVLSITGNLLGSAELNWNTLTQLTMEDVTLSECIEALRRAPHLVKCTFQRDRDSALDPENYDFPLPPKPIVHARLQHLEVKADLYEDLLWCLLCPSLKILALDIEEFREVDMPLIVEFLKTSGCYLEGLLISHADIFPSEITSLCQEIPTLHHLSIQWLSPSAVSSLLVYLADFSTVDGKTQPRYLPALCSLHLETMLTNEVVFEWSLLPAIFGHCTAHPAEHHRRMLESVVIDIDSSGITSQHFEDMVNIHTPDSATIVKILRLKEAGVEWKILFGPAKVDLIPIAVKHIKLCSLNTEY